MRKRLLSLMLAVTMIVGILPVNVFAAEDKIEKIDNFVTRTGDVISLNLPDGDYIIRPGVGEFTEDDVTESEEILKEVVGTDVLDLSTLSKDELDDYLDGGLLAVAAKEDSIMKATEINGHASFKDLNLAEIIDVEEGENGISFVVFRVDRNNNHGNLDGYSEGYKAYAVTGIGFSVQLYEEKSTPAPDPILVEFYNNDGTHRVQKGNYNYEGGLHNDFLNSFGFGSTKLQNRAMGADDAVNPTSYKYLAPGYDAGVIGWATEPNQTVPTLTAETMGTAYHSTTVKRVVEDLELAEVLEVNGQKVVRFYAVYKPAPVTVRYWTPADELIMMVTKTFTNPNRDGNTVGFMGGNTVKKANDLAPTGYQLEGWTFEDHGTIALIIKNSHELKELVDKYGATIKEEDGKLYIDVYAVWEPIEYTVTFHSNNGDDETVVQNFVYDEAQNLTANKFEGKTVTLNDGTVMTPTFMGWATELKDNEAETVVYTNMKEVINLTAEHGGNIDLYAVWELKRIPAQLNAAYKVEHHFQQNGDYVLDDKETQFPVVGELGAEITAAKHKINKTGYHLNDTLSKSVVVEMPKTVDGELVVTTLQVYYDRNSYDITVDTNAGGTVKVPGTALYGADVSYTITPNRGYRLVSAKMVCGNDEADLMSSDSFTMPAGDVTVVVKFEKIIFNIDIANHTGGKVVATVNGVETKEATIGDEVVFVVTPDEGWKLVTMNYQIKVDGSQIGGGNAASAQKITMPAGDVYVKPVFEKIIYNINVAESQYGTVIAKVNGTKANTATIGDIVTFEVAPEIGYKLNKLNYYFTLGAGGGMKGDDTLTMRASDLKITPKWDPITYSITFHANGGQGSMGVQNFVYDKAQNLTKNAFTKESTLVNNDTMTYTFMGWATAADGAVVYANEASVINLTAVDNDNINLYAIWVPNQVSALPAYGATYFVEHYVEGPNNSYQMVEKEILNGKIGDVVTADSTKHIKTGYHMNDEASTLNGTISFDMTAADLMASLLTLQVYYDLNEYTVTFHANNGKNEETVQNFVYTEAQNLTKNAFTKEITLINGETMTHTFMGWATAADGAVVYADEASVINLTETNNGNIDLYAIWVPNQVSALPAQGATYFVEHYVENRNNGYQLVEKEILGGKIGDVVTADSTKYIDSTHHLDSTASTLEGTISFDLSAAEPMDTLLTLKVYYALNPIKGSSGGGSTKYTVTVEDTDNGSVESSRTRVSKGTTVTITVDPEVGYKVDDIVVKTKAGKEVEVTDKGEGKFTFKMPAANVIVSVDFAEAAVSDDNVQAAEEYILLTIDSVIAWVFDEYVTNDVAPVLRNARTMLPARFVAEALGSVVTWDEAEQKVIIVNGEDTIEIYIGEPFAIVNGDPVELDSPAFIENDRTYLPVRFIAENLGATVTWNGATQEVTITPVKN